MNKKNARLFVILILTLLIGVSCKINMSDISEIKIVNLENDEIQIVEENSKTALYIVDSINKKEKVDNDISSLTSFDVFVEQDSKSDGYTMSFDIDNQEVYLSKDDLVFKVKKNLSKNLLLDDSFSYIYINDTMSDVSFIQNQEMKLTNIQYDWSFKDINGEIKSKSCSIINDNENIIINKDDEVDIIYSEKPDSQIIMVYLKGEIIHTGKTISDAINYIENDGEYYIETEAKWNQKSDAKGYGKQTISFTVYIDNVADFTIVTKENYPGNILLISVDNLNKDETVKIVTDAVKENINIYKYGEKHISIFPINLYAKPSEYEVKGIFNEGTDKEYVITKTLNILKKDFKTQYLTVTEELNNNNNDDKAILEFIEYVKPARMDSTPEKLWEGEFLMPVQGRLTTDFAEIRYVNNEMSSSRHSGIDLAAETGTEIIAPNNGKVTLDMNGLLSSGNTLVIDHGMGLFTSYYHLDKILVKAGDAVEKGDVIGTVGTTGFSTGPHLHYAISIYNTYVNTYQPLSGIFD